MCREEEVADLVQACQQNVPAVRAGGSDSRAGRGAGGDKKGADDLEFTTQEVTGGGKVQAAKVSAARAGRLMMSWR